MEPKGIAELGYWKDDLISTQGEYEKIYGLGIKWKMKNTTLSEQFQNQNSKSEKDKIDTPNKEISARSISWPGLLSTNQQSPIHESCCY